MQIGQVLIDGTVYIAPSWQQMGKLVFKLGKSIIQQKQHYDWLISIAKGGWTWSRSLADILQIDSVASIKTKLYGDIAKQNHRLIMEQPLPAGVKVRNKSILLFDDVADSGKTLSVVRAYLNQNKAARVGAATLFYKPASTVKPDYYAYTTNAWIIFPHEIREFVSSTAKKWLKQNFSVEQILKRYDKIKLPKEQVKYFLNACEADSNRV